MNKFRAIGILFLCFQLSGCTATGLSKDLQPVDLERYPLPQNKFRISLISYDTADTSPPATKNQITASLLQSGYFQIGDGNGGCNLKIFVGSEQTADSKGLTFLFPLFTLGIVPGGADYRYQLYSEIICDNKVITTAESKSDAFESLGFLSRLFGTSTTTAQKTVADVFVSKIIQSIHDSDGAVELLKKASE